ncbi:peptidoglycan binding protein CsiV [Porticoccaceae bacterium]|nr:peptidoglycan binding protein CsiV [Porticoccaceae bacterium]
MIAIAPAINAYAEEPSQEIEAPDNWYQVEVILFTQNGNTGGEAPPQDYDLSFPENWLELIDPNMPLEQDGFPLAQGSLLYESAPGNSLRTIPMAVVADPLADNGPSTGQTTDTEEQYSPQYQAPFVLLDKEFRDLNDSAAALDRRQYNVVFHEAWRFAADENGADPWVLIKTGQSVEGRFQLEGSMRFYKSRFLHFQSDLWLLQFANTKTGEPSRLIELPAFPVAPEVMAVPEAIGDEIKVGDEAALEEYFLDSTAALDTRAQSALLEDSEAAAHDQSQAKKYPVESVWVLKKSKRIEEQTIYYIDHPEMGIMLTIKPFTPDLLNPPEEVFPQGIIPLPQSSVANKTSPQG